MRITVIPASTKTGRAVTRALLDESTTASLSVQGVYRDLNRVPLEFTAHQNFTAVQGDLADSRTLDVRDADAVLAITPPRLDGSDIFENAKIVSENIKIAVQRTGTVKRLVLLSSAGAQFEHGTGEIKTNHIAESILKDSAPEVVFVRCVYFMENWAMALETVKDSPQPYFFSVITPLDFLVPMIAVDDIGRVCAEQLLATGADMPVRPYAFELHGPRDYTVRDVQNAFQNIIKQKVTVKPIETEQLTAFFSQVLPPSIVGSMVEMTRSFLPGGILTKNVPDEKHIKRGQVELLDVIKNLCDS